MFFSKVVCLQCAQYGSCPQKTRLYVNYCGSKKERLEKDIRHAMSDCHSRRGFIIRHRDIPLVMDKKAA